MIGILAGLGSTIGSILLDKGVNLLGTAVKNTTEAGVAALGDMVKTKTGIDILKEDTVQNLTTEEILQLKQLEVTESENINSTMLEYTKLMHANTADARNMQLEIIKSQDAGWLAKNFVYVFTIFWSLFSASYILAATFMVIPEANLRLVDTFTGFVLGTIVATMFNYFLGDSVKQLVTRTPAKVK